MAVYQFPIKNTNHRNQICLQNNLNEQSDIHKIAIQTQPISEPIKSNHTKKRTYTNPPQCTELNPKRSSTLAYLQQISNGLYSGSSVDSDFVAPDDEALLVRQPILQQAPQPQPLSERRFSTCVSAVRHVRHLHLLRERAGGDGAPARATASTSGAREDGGAASPPRIAGAEEWR